MKLTFFTKSSISLSVIAILTLIIIWTVVRSRYQATVFEERVESIKQLQNYSIDNLDRTITSWLEVTRLLAVQVAQKPADGEIILNSTLSVHPEIVQVKIESMYLSDELVSQNTTYPALKLDIPDSSWLQSRTDTSIYVTWFAQPASPRQVFVSRTLFWAEKIPFYLTIAWNAQQLVDIFAETSLRQDYSVSIHSPTGLIVRNDSSYNIGRIFGMLSSLDTIKSVQDGSTAWRVIKTPFHSVRFWMVAAIPENAPMKPVERLMIYSTSLILIFALVIFILEWFFTLKIKRFIRKLRSEVTAVNKR